MANNIRTNMLQPGVWAACSMLSWPHGQPPWVCHKMDHTVARPSSHATTAVRNVGWMVDNSGCITESLCCKTISTPVYVSPKNEQKKYARYHINQKTSLDRGCVLRMFVVVEL